MALEHVFATVGLILQEAAAKMSAKELRDSISKGVDAAHKDGPRSANYVDHTGDDKAGSVVYQIGWSGDDYRQAPYTKADGGHTVDADNATKVKPKMSWDATEAAKPADKPAETKEAAAPAAVTLVESMVSFPDLPATFSLTEGAAKPYPLVKIINEGRGSSGYYTKEVLKRDGPAIYKAGTPMFINHATATEAAQRPERDWNTLAAVTTGDAYWDEAGRDGPALYAPADIFSRYESEVREKAKHTGVSICASGLRDDKAMAPDGKPGMVTALTRGESIDMVTRAGRGGKLLIESAISEGGQMADTEVQKLQEATRNINLRLASDPARRLATTTLATIRLPEASKVAITERALTHVAITEAGAFDEAGFKTVLESEIRYAASFIPGGATVVGMGSQATPDPKVTEAAQERSRKDREFSMNRSAGSFGVKTEMGKRIFREGRAAFDPNYNSADKSVAVEA